MLSSWEHVLQCGPAVRAAEQSLHVKWPFPSKCKLECNTLGCKSMCSSCHSEGGEELTEEA